MPYPYTYQPTTTWMDWNQTATTTATIPIWTAWTSSAATTYTPTQTWNNWVTLGSQTAMPRQTQLDGLQRNQRDQMARYRVEVAAAEAKRKAAEARALELLEANLILQERDRLRKHGHIIVHGRSGVRYRIRHGRSGNIDVINSAGFITDRLCAHPIDYVPDSDTMLAQKLMLEHDEAGLLKVANRHGLPPGSRVAVLPALT